MSGVRNKPCMTHYPDFDHYCASKGQGCKYYEPEQEVKTDSRYWDCECGENYIHKKSIEPKCSVCGFEHEECSDSRPNEIRLYFKDYETERDPKQHFTGQTDKFEQSFKKIFINEEEE